MSEKALPDQNWAEQINAAWNKSLGSIFDCGRLIIAAKDSLEHGQFEAMVDNELSFGPRTAQRLMSIFQDERLSNATHGSVLPASWHTLYEITKLSDKQYEEALNEGIICPDMQRADLTHWRKLESRTAKHKDIAEQARTAVVAKDQKFNLIYADPPWTFDTFSEKGKDIGPDAHYPTTPDAELYELDIGGATIQERTADDAVLFLWCTPANLARAMALMTRWGFEYRTNITWFKDRTGTGYWVLQNHEHLLVGVKGKTIAPLYQPPSCIAAPREEHSKKPDIFRETIERMFPHWSADNRIELFARGKFDGWTVWGNEAKN